MDRAQLLRAFCDHFEEFVADILRVFPGDSELRTVGNALGAIRKMNPRLLQIVFYEKFALPYRAQIEAGDTDFFVDKNWSNDISDSPDHALSKEVVLGKIERMRDSVRQMRSSDQQKAIKYLKNLLRLSELYHQN